MRGLIGVATAPEGAPPFWLISTRTATFLSTLTISLWVARLVAAPAIEIETSVIATTEIDAAERNLHRATDRG